MAISGTWAERYANAQSYTGATRWGTGVNPVHALRDNPGRVTGVKENLYPLGDASDAVADTIVGADDYVSADWDGEEPYPDEVFRYQDSEPRWGTNTETFRGESNSDVMGEQPPWGPLYPESDDFPLGGPTGGSQEWLDVPHGEAEEHQHAIAIPTQPVAGGWRNKARSALALAKDNTTQAVGDPSAQWAVNTGQVQGQGVKYLDNSRAVARGTDSARESILSRTAAMRAYSPAVSFQMGGGAGSPDMYPFQLTAGLKRPFTARQPGLPPEEEHYWNEMEGRYPLQRTVPPDPYQGDPEVTGTTGGAAAIADEGGDWY